MHAQFQFALRALVLLVGVFSSAISMSQMGASGPLGFLPPKHSTVSWPKPAKTSRFTLPKELLPFSVQQTQLGTDFWIAFPTIYEPEGNWPISCWLYLTSEQGAVANVSIPGLGLATSVNVPAGGYANVQLPTSAFLEAAEGKQNLGIHVTASQEITLYGVADELYASDGFTAWPVTNLGRRYIVGGRDAGVNKVYPSWQTVMGVVAVANDTTITVTPKTKVGPRAAGVPYQVNLNVGEVYQLIGEVGLEDVSGTIVTSNKSVAVFGGSGMSWIPLQRGTGNYLMEQQLPDHIGGTSFPITPFARRTTARYRCFGLVDNTTVMLNGSPVTAIDRGEFDEFEFSGAGIVTADHPIQLFQFANGQDYEASPEMFADPTMTTVVPSDRYLSRYVVANPATAGAVDVHFLNVIAPTTAIDTVFVDGQQVSGFTLVPGSAYSYASLEVDPGSHIVESTVPIGVTVYGWGLTDGYCFPGGMNLAPINWTIDSVDLTPNPIVGSQQGVGKVTLNAPAGPSGIQVSLSSSDTTYCRVPASVLVQPGQYEASFTFETSLTTVERQVFVTGSYGQSVKARNLTIRPNAFVEFSATPNPVLGGNMAQGKVRLAVNSVGNAVFNLTSSNTLAATVPSSVTISGGQNSKTFTITTKAVTVPQTRSFAPPGERRRRSSSSRSHQSESRDLS